MIYVYFLRRTYKEAFLCLVLAILAASNFDYFLPQLYGTTLLLGIILGRFVPVVIAVAVVISLGCTMGEVFEHTIQARSLLVERILHAGISFFGMAVVLFVMSLQQPDLSVLVRTAADTVLLIGVGAMVSNTYGRVGGLIAVSILGWTSATLPWLIGPDTIFGEGPGLGTSTTVLWTEVFCGALGLLYWVTARPNIYRGS